MRRRGELKAEAQREGMVSMYEDGMRKAISGHDHVRRGPSRHARGLAMPVYRYRAVNPAGEVATGELDAANESEIVDRLRDQGLMPMQIAHATVGGSAAASAAPARDGRRRRWFESKTVTRDQLLAITRELATLLRAGLTARSRAGNPDRSRADACRWRLLLQDVRDDVRGGKALSQALDARREIFSRFYVNIVRAGEAGGALGEVLQRLADTMERNKELREIGQIGTVLSDRSWSSSR